MTQYFKNCKTLDDLAELTHIGKTELQKKPTENSPPITPTTKSPY